MKQLVTIKNVVNEIAERLLQDRKLIKLIVDDTSDLSTKLDEDSYADTYSMENMLKDNYICLYPIVETDGIKDTTRNTFLVIKLSLISFSGTNGHQINGTGNIYVTTNKAHYLLDGGQNRALEICDCICKDLDGAKLSSSKTVNIDSISDVVVGEDRAGYSISYDVVDQLNNIAEKAEI